MTKQSGNPRNRHGKTVVIVFLLGVGFVAVAEGWLPFARNEISTEAYASDSGSATFDHSLFDGLLRKHVDDAGYVSYAALAKDASDLDRYITAIGKAPFDSLARDEKLALLLNGYNAFTLRLILDHYPVKSIKDISGGKRWKHRRWSIAGKVLSLNDIEHEQIRPKFKEPRIHFALVCAAIGCPPLRPEAYTATRLEEQLQSQTDYVHTHDRWFRLDASGKSVSLTQLYKWYGGDFKQSAGSVLAFAAKCSSTLAEAMKSGRKPKIKWLNYDWTLNDISNKP